MAEISKKHHDGDDDGNKKDDNKRKLGSEKSTDHHHDDESDSKKMKKKSTDEVEDESKSSSRKRKVSSDDHGSSSSSSKKPKEEVINEGVSSCIGVPNILLDMPGDLMTEVCLQLPPTSVLRILLASKLWYQTISDPSFLRNHAVRLHRSQLDNDGSTSSSTNIILFDNEPPGLLICPSHTHEKHPVYALLPPQEEPNVGNLQLPPLKRLLDEFLPDFQTRFPTSIVVDSCNGLILYLESRIPDQLVNSNPRPNDISIMICNPVLKQYQLIPAINLFRTNFKKPESVVIKGYPHLLFDPTISPTSFKVLLILHEPSSNEPTSFTEFQIHIYSSETHEWKYLNTFPHDGNLLEYWESVMFKEVWYCVKDRDILCVNARDESIHFVDLPPIPDEFDSRDVYYFGESSGRLKLIEDYGTQFPFRMTVMELEVIEQKPNWIHKGNFIIDAAAAGYEEEANPGAIKVMHPYKNKDQEEILLLNMNHQRFVSFNLTTETFGNVITIPHLENSNNIEAFPFTPTLCPLPIGSTLPI